MYANSQGVDVDQKKACEYYEISANQGHMDAQYNFGIMLEEGRSGTKDEVKACKYYEMAANQGHMDAQFNFGIMLEEGRGFGKDEKRAREFYQKAADQGHAEAQMAIRSLQGYESIKSKSKAH